MAALKCEICGGSLILMNDTETFECESCGTKYPKRVLQKMYAEITGTVRVEGSVQVSGIASVTSLIQRAQEFEQGNNYEKAKEYYNRVLDIDPTNDEARQGLDAPKFSLKTQEKVLQIVVYIKKGERLNAIKAYRDLTGEGLLEAKEMIESIPKDKDIQDIINLLLANMKS